MLPVLFPGVYQIWGHLLTIREMLFLLKALKFRSNYTKLNTQWMTAWFPKWIDLLKNIKMMVLIQLLTVEEDTSFILKSRFCFCSPSSVIREFIISAEWYIPLCTALELKSLSLTRTLFRNT